MIDNITIKSSNIKIPIVKLRDSMELGKMKLQPQINDLGEIVYYKGQFENMNFRCYHRSDSVEIRGSIHKFYHSTNANDFYFDELPLAVERLEDAVGFDLKSWDIKKIEYGVNLSEPPDFSRWTFIRSKKGCPMTKNNKQYGTKFYMTDYTVKQYDKQFQLNKQFDECIPVTTRIEKEVKYMKHLHRQGIGCNKVRSLFSQDVQKHLANDLIKTCRRIKLTPQGSGLTLGEQKVIALYETGRISNLTPQQRATQNKAYMKIMKNYTDGGNIDRMECKLRSMFPGL